MRGVVFLEPGARHAGGRRWTPCRVPVSPDRPGTDAAVTALPGVGAGRADRGLRPGAARRPRAGVVGVAHAGRVGAAAGVLPATLAAMDGAGRARRATARRCWARRVRGVLRGARARCATRSRRRCRAAPPGPGAGRRGWTCAPGLRAQLAALGVARVGADPRCTVEDPDLYSYRRDRRTGRLAAVTWLDPSRSRRAVRRPRTAAEPVVGTFWRECRAHATWRAERHVRAPLVPTRAADPCDSRCRPVRRLAGHRVGAWVRARSGARRSGGRSWRGGSRPCGSGSRRRAPRPGATPIRWS